MLVALAAVGALLIVVGLFGLIRPGALQKWVKEMNPTLRYVVAVGVRVGLGLLIVYAAPETRWPIQMRLLGYFVLAVALALMIAGPRRLGHIVDWWSGRSAAPIRIGSLAAIAFGALFIVAGM